MIKKDNRGAYNDGEVIIKKSRCPILDEAENTEEVTVKVSPVKQRAKLGTQFAGLGKCSRVAFSRDPTKITPTFSRETESSDEGESNKNDISTFLRPQRIKSSVALRSTARPQIPGALDAVKVFGVSGINPTSSVDRGRVCSNKNFVMDNEMKNFDPAEWRKVRTVSKLEMPLVVLQCDLQRPNDTAKPKISLPSLALTARGTDLSDDESDEQETCPLDISICETKKIDVKKTVVPIRHHRAAERDVEVTFKQQEKVIETCQSSSSSSSGAGMKRRSNDGIEADAEAGLVCTVGSDVEEGCAKRMKRVSFAGNPQLSKRSHKERNLSVKSGRERGNPDREGGKEWERDTLTLEGTKYTRLNVLGKGGSSCVYRVISQSDHQLYAYKRVDVKGSIEDSEAVFDSYVNEIELLKRLKGSSPYIIDLVGAEVNREQMYIAIVMEAGEVDLAKVISQKQRQCSGSGSWVPPPPPYPVPPLSNANGDQSAIIVAAAGSGKEVMNPFFVRMVWQEMLEAVDHIHAHRIVHGDLKPANFVFVKGHLKLIDFGIAKAFSNDTTNIYRESQIGTVNYMAPEAIAPYTMDTRPGLESSQDHEGMSMRLGRASDIWSLGCILYQMSYGRPPFAALTTIQKLHAIPNPQYAIQYPEEVGQGQRVDADAVHTMKACLERDPRKRAGIRGEGGLLSMPYLSVDAMRGCRSSTVTTENESEVLVSKEKLRCAVLQAMRSLTGQAVSDARQERFLEKVWGLLKVSPEGQGADSLGAVAVAMEVEVEVEPIQRECELSEVEKLICVREQGDVESESATCVIALPAVSSSMCVVTDAVWVLPSIQRDNKENCPFSVAKASAKSEMGAIVSSKLAILRSSRVERSTAEESDVSALPSNTIVTAHGQGEGRGQGQRKTRQPLGSLHIDQSLALSDISSNVPRRNQRVASGSRSPDKDKVDQRSVVEKRIGAMREFLDDEEAASSDGTAALDFSGGFF